MKRIMSVSVLALLLVASAASATPPSDPRLDRARHAPLRMAPVAPRSVAVPGGSYLQSCADVRVEGDTLRAECKMRSGARYSAHVSVSGCKGADIENHGGQLRCATPVRERWSDTVLPPGSYLESCDALFDGGVLYANCGTGQGETKVLGIEVVREGRAQTQLDMSACMGFRDIANISGDLTCVR